MPEKLRRYAATIAVALVVSSLAGGGTAIAIIANADKVDGYHANQLIRFARTQIDNDAIIGDGTDHVALETSIRAPKKGFLFVVASADVLGGAASGRCWIELDGTVLAASDRLYVPDNNEEDCATHIGRPVGRGPHEVQFVGNPDTGSRFEASTLEVLFVPFNGRGNVPGASASGSSSPG
jgi:hypothetical protein